MQTLCSVSRTTPLALGTTRRSSLAIVRHVVRLRKEGVGPPAARHGPSAQVTQSAYVAPKDVARVPHYEDLRRPCRLGGAAPVRLYTHPIFGGTDLGAGFRGNHGPALPAVPARSRLGRSRVEARARAALLVPGRRAQPEPERRTGNAVFLNAAFKALELGKRAQPMHARDADIRGGIPGSDPIWGDYLYNAFPNWAAKFFVDALLEKRRVLKDLLNLNRGSAAWSA